MSCTDPPSEVKDTQTMSTTITVASLTLLAALTHADAEVSTIWCEVGRVLEQQFGYSLFTILTYSPTLDKVVRIHSTRPDLHPLGARNSSQGSNSGGLNRPGPPPQREAWIQHVVVAGEIWRGSTKDHLKAVFEDWELLWSVGLGSVLNIPVRVGGKTIGSLNVLGQEHAYDGADLSVGILVAQMVALSVDKVREGHVSGSELEES